MPTLANEGLLLSEAGNVAPYVPVPDARYAGAMTEARVRHEAWGKLDRLHPDPATAPRLSLVGHSIDVAAVARALLELPTWRDRFDQLAGRPLRPIDIDRLTVLAFWHDVGKAGAGFYVQGASAPTLEVWRRRYGRQYFGHTRVVAPLLKGDPDFHPHRHALGVEALESWSADPDAFFDLWLAAVSHHGQPITEEDLGGAGDHPSWRTAVDGYEPLHGLSQLGKTARELWPNAFTEEPSAPLGDAICHGFAGLVSLADWIGSNAEDVRFFPYDFAPQDASRWAAALPRAREVLRIMRIDVEDARTDLRQRDPSFLSVFGFSPQPAQLSAADPARTSPVILEAETGSGKTEAALWRFKALFEEGKVDALCFLLPTRVSATGIYRRLHTFIERCFPNPTLRPTVVLGVPGYLRANGEEGRWLARFHVLWGDEQRDAALFWAAENSKRYFAGTAVAATIDQFLMTTLQTGHSHLRATIALRALVVADEVHASDRYMRTLLKAALKRHIAAGGHALLLSATLASDAREDFLHCAAPSLPLETVGPADGDDLQHDYPRISSPRQLPWIGQPANTKHIEVRLEACMLDPKRVAAFAAVAVQEGARVLVVRNTVRHAVATQRALEAALGGDHPMLFRCGGIASPHHGRYALPDRQALDAAVEHQFGKQAASDTRACVLCATQTLEISVDCDADYLITDLAPMDVLLQRLGRLHRHPKRHDFRPLAHRVARVVVLVPPDRNLAVLMNRARSRGLGIGPMSAYPDLLALEATWRELEDSMVSDGLRIPEQNRALVERTCHLRRLSDLADELGEPWQAHRNELTGKASAAGTQALYVTQDWSRPWREATPGELQMEARTRLGLDGIDLELPQPWSASPFGNKITSIPVPAWMLPAPEDGAGGPPKMEIRCMNTQRLIFSVRERDLVYDRLGLARVTDAN